MRLGTATWSEGTSVRQALVARLESGRLADLTRIEAVRLGKLGEGGPEALAERLVPPTLREVLEGGRRALARARQAVAYAEKWDRRGTLPSELGLLPGRATLLPCLPRPAHLRRLDGSALDRFAVLGTGATCAEPPQAGLAALGAHGGGLAGYCLYLEAGSTVVLGPWMMDAWPEGSLVLSVGGARRTVPLQAWEGLELPPLRPGEVVLLPPARVKGFPDLGPGTLLKLSAAGEHLTARFRPDLLHPTVQ